MSPAWYATKAEHGRVVPDLELLRRPVTGRVRRHEDPEWLRSAVTLLTEQHESGRAEPWAVTDAPATYVDKQLRAIVGLEVTIERVEGKAKLSQNRSEEDRAGVVAGLRAEGGARESAVAEQMERLARLERELGRHLVPHVAFGVLVEERERRGREGALLGRHLLDVRRVHLSERRVDLR